MHIQLIELTRLHVLAFAIRQAADYTVSVTSKPWLPTESLTIRLGIRAHNARAQGGQCVVHELAGKALQVSTVQKNDLT